MMIILASLFMTANQQYESGNYAEAAATYEQVLATNPTAEVYYNLGNAEFKQGNLAQAILAYERCLKLDPRHNDAKYNLEFAQTQIVDNIRDHEVFFVSAWVATLRDSFNESTWMLWAICLFVLALVGFLTFALSHIPAVRKSAFFAALIALIVSFIALANAGSKHYNNLHHNEGVIIQGIVNAKSSPDRSGTDLFTLHEGTKVTIEETLDRWCRIKVGAYVGWIHLDNLERI